MNDLWDRDLDKAVERTRTRPLASGAVTPAQATGEEAKGTGEQQQTSKSEGCVQLVHSVDCSTCLSQKRSCHTLALPHFIHHLKSPYCVMLHAAFLGLQLSLGLMILLQLNTFR